MNKLSLLSLCFLLLIKENVLILSSCKEHSILIFNYIQFKNLGASKTKSWCSLKIFFLPLLEYTCNLKLEKKGIDNQESPLLGFELNGILLGRHICLSSVLGSGRVDNSAAGRILVLNIGMWILVWIFLLVAYATLGKALNLSVPQYCFSFLIWLIEEVVYISLRYLSAKIFSESGNSKRKSTNIS